MRLGVGDSNVACRLAAAEADAPRMASMDFANGLSGALISRVVCDIVGGVRYAVGFSCYLQTLSDSMIYMYVFCTRKEDYVVVSTLGMQVVYPLGRFRTINKEVDRTSNVSLSIQPRFFIGHIYSMHGYFSSCGSTTRVLMESPVISINAHVLRKDQYQMLHVRTPKPSNQCSTIYSIFLRREVDPVQVLAGAFCGYYCCLRSTNPPAPA